MNLEEKRERAVLVGVEHGRQPLLGAAESVAELERLSETAGVVVAAKVVQKYTKVEDKEILAHSMTAEGKAMAPSLQVDPKGIELILGLISKAVPQAAAAKPEDFFDPKFFTELRDSGFLKRLKVEKS